MVKKLPGDIDLTLKMDFSKDEVIPSSIHIPKEKKDTSYKRYNEYKSEYATATVGSDTDSWYDHSNFISNVRATLTGTGTVTMDMLLHGDWSSFTPWGSNINKVEERVCWRKLYKDPRVYSESHTPDEWNEIIKNTNFPMGSKKDRAYAVYQQKLRDEGAMRYEGQCECCGRHFNVNNCLSHVYDLCTSCNARLESVVSVRL